MLRERARGVVAALDAAADVDVVSTLEAEAARLASELVAAEAEEEAGAAPERAELDLAVAALDEEAGALRERWAAVLGDDADAPMRPSPRCAPVRSRSPAPPHASNRTWTRSGHGGHPPGAGRRRRRAGGPPGPAGGRAGPGDRRA